MDRTKEDEKFCLRCHRVFIAKHPQCCGGVVPFSKEEHTQYLVGASNSWIHVWTEWKNHPLLIKTSNKLTEQGCFSASICLSEFIADLLAHIDTLREQLAECHDWHCGCDHWNGANLPFCACCGRKPNER